MPAGASLFRERWRFLFITFCTLITFLLQFVFRNADDNRLTSWKWAFADLELTWFIPLILLGIIFIYTLLNSPITRQRPSIFLFLVSFAVGAIFWEVPEVIIDTSRYFTQAKHLEIYGIKYFVSQWGKNINVWTDLPLVPFLYGLIFKFFGEARAFIQVFTTFAFSITVVLSYLIGKTLWDKDTGFFAGVLLWGIPYIFSQTPLMLVDVPTMFFLTLSIYTFIKALQKGGVWIAVSSISVFCAVFSKYSNWMMLSVLVVIFLVYIIQRTEDREQNTDYKTPNPQLETRNSRPATRNPEPGIRNCICRGASVALIAGLLVGVIALLKYDVIVDQIRFLREYQVPGLKRWGESFASTFLYQIHPFITAAALFSVYRAFRKKDLKFLIILWLIVLMVLMQIRRSRYVLVIFPMVTLMASYGLQKIKSMETRRYVVSCIVAASLVMAMFAHLSFLQKMSLVNLKDAGRFLDSIDAEKIEVFTIQSSNSVVNPAVSVPILDLFTGKDICYHHDINLILPFEEIEKSPLRFTWDYKNPEYYMCHQKTSSEYPIILVISNRNNVKILPERIRKKVKGYDKAKLFETTTGLFRYSPSVTMYLPE
jgi:hypothetical protein